MTKSAVLFITIFLSIYSTANAYPDAISRIFSGSNSGLRNSQVKGIQNFGGTWGIASTADALFITADGTSWAAIDPRSSGAHIISAAHFVNEAEGYVLELNPETRQFELAATQDGGNSWKRSPVYLDQNYLSDAYLENAELAGDGKEITLWFRLTTSSNFEGYVVFVSPDGGQNWQIGERRVELNRSDEPENISSGTWTLVNEGTCAGFKTGCVMESKILRNGEDITPPAIRQLLRSEKETASIDAVPMFAAVPGGATRISLNRGFDKCTAGSVVQMQAWWNTSHFYDANIYMSGRARACSQPQLTAAWVDQVSAMGWGLIPTVVGYQAPCSVSTTIHKHSSDPVVAEQQGRGEADIAVNDAMNLGLTQGSVIYYDMERYNDPGDGVCSTSVKAFLKGWTDRIKELGYISGVYGSPTNAVGDWLSIPAASRMDAIWMARWDNVMSVWVYNSPSPAFPAGAWENHQRIKQWQAPHLETWGGVTFEIDGNIADGPVAGVFKKNKNADFDGDGMADHSVFRPDTGTWFVLNSSNSAFSGTAFGAATDIPAPGDYDGDGKTDYAVFRPADGIWHILTKGGIYSARQFGQAGDVPVPGDFNGDGKTDIAVFRPSNGVWYIANSDSRGTFTILLFGLNGDKPVVGDYDGDGRSDVAVFRPSAGTWYILKSSDGSFSGIAFGVATDRPAQGDYDGDGKTDLGVFRDGTWFLNQTTAGTAILQFGSSGDIPLTADYDGDNKADISIFRPSNGGWYLFRSLAGISVIQFGMAGDRPVPTAYLPQ